MAAAWPGKIKTATQMVAIILLLINNVPFAAMNFPLDQIMLYTCLIFTIYSGVDYFAKNKHVFKGSM
jgi:CDP-diacylglycerol--glycerol-3-phosphate 3-phosphatidyltransferase